jgi:predicted phosphoribosyltransferase
MIFKDRAEAGKKLAAVLSKDKDILKKRKNIVIFSLLRGGAIVGYQIAKRLSFPHFSLIVKKIGAPFNEELAIGALCNNEYFLDDSLIKRLGLDKGVIDNQIEKAKQKQKEYFKKFTNKKKFPTLRNKTIILVDDGIATGASILAALKYLRKQKTKKVILAVPVTPTDFSSVGFDKAVILHRDLWFNAVSQFYQEFGQLSDEEVKRAFD